MPTGLRQPARMGAQVDYAECRSILHPPSPRAGRYILSNKRLHSYDKERGVGAGGVRTTQTSLKQTSESLHHLETGS